MSENPLRNTEITNRKSSQDIRTTKELFNVLNQFYHFDLDPCDSNSHPEWLDVQTHFNTNNGLDGLLESWWEHGNAFINPPYNNIPAWQEKGFHELKQATMHEVGVRQLWFVPAKTNTKWFHRFLQSNFYINHWFPDQRIVFEDKRAINGNGVSEKHPNGRDDPLIQGIVFIELSNLHQLLKGVYHP